MDTYIHTIIHTYIIHTCIHTYIHTYMHACIHTYNQTILQSFIHTYLHTYIHEAIRIYEIHLYNLYFTLAITLVIAWHCITLDHIKHIALHYITITLHIISLLCIPTYIRSYTHTYFTHTQLHIHTCMHADIHT